MIAAGRFRNSAAFAFLAVAAFIAVIVFQPVVPGNPETARELQRVLLWHSLLPRSCVALLAGAALGLAGALLQGVLRNPLADPSTLGIASGAQLALTAALAYAPGLIAFSREAVALGGGLAAAGIVLALNWRRGLEPVSVVLSGMMLSLVAASLSVTIILAEGDYVMSLFIWGAGSLNQQDWQPAVTIAIRLAAGMAVASLLIRPLTLLGLDDSGAKSLGLTLHTWRLLVVVLAVWLAATVTAEVGVIGFVGLAAPAIARAAGARTAKHILMAAPVAGALLLLLTDSAVQLAGNGFSDLAPTGAATALLGGPLLLWLLPRLRGASRPPAPRRPDERARRKAPWRTMAAMALLTALLALITLMSGRGPDGWSLATGALFHELLPFRGPRILAAAAAGAMLAAAGTLVQRLSGNPMASPEVLGVSAGGGVGLAATLFIFAFPDPLTMMAGMALGALVTLLFILAMAARSGFSPEKLLLAGIATGAFCMAILTTVMAGGGLRGYVLLTWMAGSTNRTGITEAAIAAVAAAVLMTPLFFFGRWLDILPLGENTGRSIGLPVGRARLTLAVLAAVLTAVASFVAGPLSLVGLIAPHAARMLGFNSGTHQLAAAALAGAFLLMLADWLSRIVIFPYQVPLGLFASLIGGPCLIWLLKRNAGR